MIKDLSINQCRICLKFVHAFTILRYKIKQNTTGVMYIL